MVIYEMLSRDIMENYLRVPFHLEVEELGITTLPPPSLNDLKTSTQEQLEYTLTKDDNAPLLKNDNEVKFEVKECVNE